MNVGVACMENNRRGGGGYPGQSIRLVYVGEEEVTVQVQIFLKLAAPWLKLYGMYCAAHIAIISFSSRLNVLFLCCRCIAYISFSSSVSKGISCSIPVSTTARERPARNEIRAKPRRKTARDSPDISLTIVCFSQSKTISTADVWIPIFSFLPAGPGIVEFRTPSLFLVREIEILTRLIAQGRRMKSRDRSSLCAFFGGGGAWLSIQCPFSNPAAAAALSPCLLGRIFTTPYSSRLDFRKLQRFPCAFTAAAMAGPWNKNKCQSMPHFLVVKLCIFLAPLSMHCVAKKVILKNNDFFSSCNLCTSFLPLGDPKHVDFFRGSD